VIGGTRLAFASCFIASSGSRQAFLLTTGASSELSQTYNRHPSQPSHMKVE